MNVKKIHFKVTGKAVTSYIILGLHFTTVLNVPTWIFVETHWTIFKILVIWWQWSFTHTITVVLYNMGKTSALFINCYLIDIQWSLNMTTVIPMLMHCSDHSHVVSHIFQIFGAVLFVHLYTWIDHLCSCCSMKWFCLLWSIHIATIYPHHQLVLNASFMLEQICMGSIASNIISQSAIVSIVQHIEAAATRPPFYKQCFEMNVLVWKLLYRDSKLTEFCSQWSNLQ